MAEPLTVVIAPDSFKGTATAAAIAAAIGSGWAEARPLDRVLVVPMADGGEGTLEAFEAAVPGAKRMPVVVQGPDDHDRAASWLLLPGDEARPGGVGVVELAETSGITLLDELAPLDAHTLGFGQAVAAALDHGVEQLLLAIGGSASTDGGAGALTALGARFLDAQNRPIRLGNRGLASLARVDLTGLRALPRAGAQILGDVTNPLLGPSGASAIFGPQKGASPEQVIGFESSLARFADLMLAVATPDGVAVRVRPDAPGAGAAGGTGFGLLVWGATIAAGAHAVGAALGLPGMVAHANLVITGEGRFDTQSAAGKVPSYIEGIARANRVPCLLVGGSIEAPTGPFADAVSLTALAGGAADAMADPLRWAHEAGVRLASRIR